MDAALEEQPVMDNPQEPGADAEPTADGLTSPVIYKWEDVTSLFANCCEELELGELLHDSR